MTGLVDLNKPFDTLKINKIKMPLIKRQEKGSKLTIQEMDGNLTYLSQNMELSSNGVKYSINLSQDGIKLLADGGGGDVLAVSFATPKSWSVPPVPGTYEVSPTTSGSGSGLILRIVISEGDGGPIITEQVVINSGSGYAIGDTLTISTSQLGSNVPGEDEFIIYELSLRDLSELIRQSIEIINVDGTLITLMPNLPIEDPIIVDALWDNVGTIAISTGEVV